jgi:acetyl-CoA acetyltransferase
VNVGRWLSRAQPLTTAFAEAFGLDLLETGALRAAHDPTTGRIAFFGHPLWRLDQAYYTAEQARAHADAKKATSADVRAFDLMTLARAPQNIFAWLVG